jgi:hypothetical protein
MCENVSYMCAVLWRSPYAQYLKYVNVLPNVHRPLRSAVYWGEVGNGNPLRKS